MWFLSWSHPGELFCDSFEWALAFLGSPLRWGRGRDQRMSTPVCSTKAEMTNCQLGWKYSPKEGLRLLGSHTADNGRSGPSSDIIKLSILETDMSQSFQHLSGLWIWGIQTWDDLKSQCWEFSRFRKFWCEACWNLTSRRIQKGGSPDREWEWDCGNWPEGSART